MGGDGLLGCWPDGRGCRLKATSRARENAKGKTRLCWIMRTYERLRTRAHHMHTRVCVCRIARCLGLCFTLSPRCLSVFYRLACLALPLPLPSPSFSLSLPLPLCLTTRTRTAAARAAGWSDDRGGSRVRNPDVSLPLSQVCGHFCLTWAGHCACMHACMHIHKLKLKDIHVHIHTAHFQR